jgi:hypothetical protein
MFSLVVQRQRGMKAAINAKKKKKERKKRK